MANRILVDTGFWFAVFNNKDCYKERADALLMQYFDTPAYEILVPFPTMYELLRTKFVKNKSALDLTLDEPRRNISLVDNIIRLMLDDKGLSAK